MQIILSNIGKRYNRDWIFRKCNFEFTAGKAYAITGPNGSGKSTLLQVIAGATIHNEGSIEYKNATEVITPEQYYQYISIATPYLDLIEELTAKETFEFHMGFKKLMPGFSVEEILKIAGLENAINKQLRYFSSGMKQRLKLALAFFCTSPILLLDEPTTNLDADGIALYHSLIKDYTKGKLIIISSNVKQEYDFCETVIEVGDYK